jgi:carbonic anhydrase
MTQRSEILQKKVAAGQLKIVGGRYDLDEGRVSWI